MSRYRLRVLGGLSVERLQPQPAPLLLPKGSLALLALLATASSRGMSRDKLLACRWPDSDTERGQNALNQALFVVRRALGAAAVTQTATEVRLEPALVESDLAEFEIARGASEHERAASLYGGPFLDGFHLGDAPEFERWNAAERSRIAGEYVQVLERLAESAEARADWPAAADWWTRLGAHEELSARVTQRAMRALANAGQREAALRLARVYEELVHQELGAAPDAAIRALADQLRAMTTGSTPVVAAAAEPLRTARIVEPGGSIARPVIAVRALAQRRVVRVGLGAMVVLGAIGAGAAMIQSAGSVALHPRRVVVTNASASVTDAPDDALGALLQARMVDGIAETHLATLSASPRAGARGAWSHGSHIDAGQARTIARAVGAGLLVATAYDVDGDSVQLRAELVDGRTGETLASIEPVRASRGSPRTAIELLRDRVMAATAARLDPKLEHWGYAAAMPASYESYRELRRGIDEFVAEHHEEATAHFRAAAALDSTSATPLVWQAFALAFHQEWVGARAVLAALDGSHRRFGSWDRALITLVGALVDGDLVRAHDASHRLEEVVPNSEWSFLRGWQAFAVGRAAESTRVLGAMDPDRGWMNGFYWYWYSLSGSYHALGNFASQLATAGDAGRRRPDDRTVMMLESSALVGLGRFADAERRCVESSSSRAPPILEYQPCLATILEMRAHDQPEIAARMLTWLVERYAMAPDSSGATPWDDVVTLLYAGGDFAGAERTLRAHPMAHDFGGPAYTALLAAARGDRPAVERALRGVEASLPAQFEAGGRVDETRAGLRAEISALLGDRDDAVDWLTREFRAGGRWRLDLRHGPAFHSLRGYPPFEALARPIDGSEERPRE